MLNVQFNAGHGNMCMCMFLLFLQKEKMRHVALGTLHGTGNNAFYCIGCSAPSLKKTKTSKTHTARETHHHAKGYPCRPPPRPPLFPSHRQTYAPPSLPHTHHLPTSHSDIRSCQMHTHSHTHTYAQHTQLTLTHICAHTYNIHGYTNPNTHTWPTHTPHISHREARAHARTL